MAVDFVKAVILVAIAASGVAALIWGLMFQTAPEAFAAIFGGLAVYALAWAGGLYLTKK